MELIYEIYDQPGNESWDGCDIEQDEYYREREEEAAYERMIDRQVSEHYAMLDAIDAEREEREAYLSGAIESVGDFSY